MPPFGFLPGEVEGGGVRVLIDASVRDLGEGCSVLVGAGSAETVLRISVGYLLHIVGCENATGGVIDSELVYDLCRSAPLPSSSPVAPQPIPPDCHSMPLRLACDSSISRAGFQPYLHL